MCGIAGIFRVEGRITADDVAAVLRMTDAQNHRGPDDWGIVLPKEAIQDSRIQGLLAPFDHAHIRTYPGSSVAPSCVFSSRRLSIIDLSPRGRMPMGTVDGRVWLTYNGEVYNFVEVRSDLERLGYVFQSNTDTETILHGYEEWGEEVLHHLRGMFSFAIFDMRSEDDPKLFLAKDRFGMKPLYWARRNGVFQFASEVRALSAGALIPPEPEPRGLHGFLVYGSVPTPFTTLRDVFCLPAAHALTIDSLTYSYPRPRRYWSLPRSGSLQISVQDAVSETRRLLEESIRMHLVADVSRGVFLSGGMDSSTITALAARHSQEPLTTLCVTFDDTKLSEGPYAAKMANRFGCKHIEVRLYANEFIEEIPRILDAMDQPSIDGVNVYFVAKAAKAAGLATVLSGLGGDEIFWGYPGFHRAPRLFRWTRLPGAQLSARIIGAFGKRLGYSYLEKLEFLKDRSPLGAYLVIRGLYPPSKAARILEAGVLPLFHPSKKSESFGPADYADLETALYLQNQLLRDSDVFGMAHGLEIRLPFLDHRLAEFVAALPEELKIAGEINKPLLHAALEKDFVSDTVNRPKIGFTLPFERWMREHAASIRRDAEPGTAIKPTETDAIWSAFMRGRVHWSRPWAVSILNGMSKKGTLPSISARTHPKRILFLLPEAYASKGGIPTYTQDFLRAVAENFPSAELRAINVNDTEIPSEAPANGCVHFTCCGPRKSALLKTRVVLTAIRETARRPPDVIICGHIHLAPLTLFLSILSRARTALLAYGIEVWEPSALHRWTARHLHQVFSISRYTADRMTAWGIDPERIHLIPPAVDGDVFRPIPKRKETDKVTFLTVARLNAGEAYKGVDAVIRVLRGLIALFPHVRYVVVGQGDDLPRLESLAHDTGISDNVMFRGSVSGMDLLTLFNEADLFVMPSRHEGFGIVFLEGLACGLPVIGGNCGGSTDALLDGRLGLLVDANEHSQLEQGLLAFLNGKTDHILLDPTRLRHEVLSNYGIDLFRQRIRAAFSTQQ